MRKGFILAAIAALTLSFNVMAQDSKEGKTEEEGYKFTISK